MFAIFDGSIGEVGDRPHLHFLVHNHGIDDRCVYSVVNMTDVQRWPAFRERIDAAIPGLLPDATAYRSVMPWRRPRMHHRRDEDEEDSIIILSKSLPSVWAPYLTVTCF